MNYLYILRALYFKNYKKLQICMRIYFKNLNLCSISEEFLVLNCIYLFFKKYDCQATERKRSVKMVLKDMQRMIFTH